MKTQGFEIEFREADDYSLRPWPAPLKKINRVLNRVLECAPS